MSCRILAPLAAAALAAQISACSPPLAVAGLALDLVGAASGGGGGATFSNPYDQPRGESLNEALSSLEDEPDPRCLGQLERAQAESERTPDRGKRLDAAEAGPGLRLVCLPGSPTPTVMFLSPASRRAGDSAHTGRQTSYR